MLAIAGCGQRDAESPPAADAAPAATAADGSPQIATSVDGVHIQYRVYGQGEPTLVFVHGWSCDSSYWNAQIDAFRQRYTVVTVDLAGHGASARNRTDWSMAHYGADVAAAVQSLPSKQIILIGHSMGGPVVIEAARLLQDRTVAVIGVDTYKSIGSPPPPAAQVAAFVDGMEQDFIGYTRGFVTNTFFTKTADQQLVNKIASDMSSAPADVAIASSKAMTNWDYVEPAKGIKVPIIAINSDLGLLTDDARISKVWPTFRSVTVTGTGHFLMMEEPARFDEVLEEQIQTIVNPASS